MNWYPSKYPLIVNPYDSFMKKHLQHYGYFTGRNLTIKRFGFEPKKGYKSDSDDSDTESTTSDATTATKQPLKPRPRDLNDNFKWWINQKDLYSLGLKELDYQREPRWPIEMQVLPERIRHINSMPNYPEPFYVRTGLEETPMSFNEPGSKTVFYYNPLNCGYFVKSRIGGSREGVQKAFSELAADADETLNFESRFESGNLMKALKVKNNEYQLYLRYDLYTNKHTQWYYFRIKNAKPNVTYRFTICNFLKPDSLYNMGMKPLMYSDSDAQTKNIGWKRWGNNIKYYKNNIKTEDNDGVVRQFYSLTWTCTFPNDNDTYYFAHCYPYTYSDLQDYLKEIQEDPVRNKFCKIKVLCRTLAENLVHLITITNQSASAEENKAKKGVIITSRVHPGETNASWMMKGFLDFLLGNSADAKLLRDNFVFKIVPMLNPDGVIIGNYRCSLTGRDLNRNYKTLLKEAFPSTWNTREMIKRFSEEREVVVYCDLHGHSRRNNVFIYGCHNNRDPKRRFKERVFPCMMNKNAGSVFSYTSCKFKIQKSKEGTGRVVMWNMGILNSFTMEATFSGSTLGKKAGFHFTTKDFESLGYYFCDTLLDYCDPDQSKVKLILNEIDTQFKEAMRKRLETNGITVDNVNQIDFDSVNINIEDLTSGGEESSDDGGSDSSADDGLPLHLEHLAKNLRQRKKRKLKTSKSFQNGKGQKEQTIKLTYSNNSNNNNSSNANHNNSHNNNNNNNNNNSNSNASNNSHMKFPINSTLGLNLEKDKQRIQSFKGNEQKEIDKRILKPLGPNAALQSQLSNQRPRSAKPLNNGIPIFTHERAEERATKKTNGNHTESETPLPDTAFRYTIQNLPPTAPNTSSTNHHLCDQHKKKLSDFFLFRHLTSIEGFKIEQKNELESDGDASDDEADLENHVENDDYKAQSQRLTKPTFEEYVNKYVLTRNTQIPLRNKSGSMTSMNYHGGMQKSRSTNLDAQPLEIKSIMKEDDHTVTLSPCNISLNTSNITNGTKDAFDFLPKHLVKQLNEKKVLTFNNSSNSTGLTASTATLSAVSSTGFNPNTTNYLNSIIQINDMSVKNRKFIRNTPGQNVISSSLSQNSKVKQQINSTSSFASNDQKAEENNQSFSSTTPIVQLHSNTKAQLDKVARSTLNRQKISK